MQIDEKLDYRAKLKPNRNQVTVPAEAFEMGAGRFLTELARISCAWFDDMIAANSWQTFINIDRTTGIEIFADESVSPDVRAQRLVECWRRAGRFRTAGPKLGTYFEAELAESPDGIASITFTFTGEELKDRNAVWFAAIGLLISEATADKVRLDWDICEGKLYETLGAASDLLDACFPLREGEPTRRERFEEHMYRAVCEWRENDLAAKLKDIEEYNPRGLRL